jgi:hypothetical protein
VKLPQEVKQEIRRIVPVVAQNRRNLQQIYRRVAMLASFVGIALITPAIIRQFEIVKRFYGGPPPPGGGDDDDDDDDDQQ